MSNAKDWFGSLPSCTYGIFVLKIVNHALESTHIVLAKLSVLKSLLQAY